MPVKKRGAKKPQVSSKRTLAKNMPKAGKVLPKQPEPQVDNVEQRIEESKYFVPPRAYEQPKPSEPQIPYNYNETKIVLLVRDPRWLHAYWEITEDKYQEARNILGAKINSSREILRVYDVSREPWVSFDLDIFGAARSWYVNVPEPGHSYIIEIGYLDPDGRFIVLARSNRVTTPLEGPSGIIDEEWMTIDFDRMYALSGGFGVGKSSGEIKKWMKKHLDNMSASGWISSATSPFGKSPDRPFFLVANTELVVYGATEPTAKLFVQGKKVDLRNDGSFTLRFALPNGTQTIPIEAIRDDGIEKRSITPKVERTTEE